MDGNNYPDERARIDELLLAISKGNAAEIEKAKLKLLWEVPDLFHVIPHYVFLDRLGLGLDFGQDMVKKGEKYFRVRKYESGVDFSDPAQWTPPPHQRQNRANHEGESALYLGSNEILCCLETHLQAKEKYALAVYECTETFDVGCFSIDHSEETLLEYASFVLNAFLCAPARNADNRELFHYLDKRFGELTLDDFASMENITGEQSALMLPYKFAVLNRREQYYELTNQVCDVLKHKYPDGIHYASCFFPLEVPGIVCNFHNLVLYQSALSKMKFIGYGIKEYNPKKGKELLTDVNIAKCMLGDIQ